MSKEVAKAPEKTPEQILQEEKKKLTIERMDALAKLEEKLDCVFVPLIQYSQQGSQTYIAPFDKPKEHDTNVKESTEEKGNEEKK